MGYDLRTQRGYDFYEVASALQKSIRRGDAKLAGYMALELFPRYAEYCWKRLRKGKAMGRTKQQFFEEEDRALSNKQLSIFDGVRF